MSGSEKVSFCCSSCLSFLSSISYLRRRALWSTSSLILASFLIFLARVANFSVLDETIIQLQEELDAYDRIHRETEQVIEQKTQRVHQLEDFITE